MSHSDLIPFGWTDRFDRDPQNDPAKTVARIAAVDRESLLLLDATGPFRAKLTGRYLHEHTESGDLPCVGDWVVVERSSPSDAGLVHAMFPRRTFLRRKTAGAQFDNQMIAANIDSIFIVQSCHYDFNLRRLERYLVMVRDGGAEPRILLTKTDLVAADELAARIAEIRNAGIDAPVLALSNLTETGIDELKQSLLPAKTYCFVGGSGVGKSTLINRLLGNERLATGTVSGTGEGRHTTVRRELIVMEGGALLIDNPGMREFGVIGESGVDDAFSDIAALVSQCRYRDCTHENEPGCAIREALETGQLEEAHYKSYMKLKAEAAFHQMSYVEKRHKDRDFGRFIKKVKKHLRND